YLSYIQKDGTVSLEGEALWRALLGRTTVRRQELRVLGPVQRLAIYKVHLERKDSLSVSDANILVDFLVQDLNACKKALLPEYENLLLNYVSESDSLIKNEAYQGALRKISAQKRREIYAEYLKKEELSTDDAAKLVDLLLQDLA